MDKWGQTRLFAEITQYFFTIEQAKKLKAWHDFHDLMFQNNYNMSYSAANNRSIIFVVEEDYSFYLQKLGEACQKFQCDLHADVTQAFRRIISTSR